MNHMRYLGVVNTKIFRRFSRIFSVAAFKTLPLFQLLFSHHLMTSVAIVSSGTDNSGINGAIRAIVRGAIAGKAKVFGVRWGYGGLVRNEMVGLTSRDVSGIIGKAGCFLGTAKPQGVLTPENVETALKNMKARNIDRMIVIGGLNSLMASEVFMKNGINVIGIPSTIQDDIPGTDIALGVDSAVNNIVKCIDKIRVSGSTTNRSYLIQVEGRSCGSLALRCAFTSGADWCLIPERPCDDNMDHLAEIMAEANLAGKRQCLTVVAAGWKPGIEELQKFLETKQKETDLYVRTTVLGYVQRGGAPSGFDRTLGTEMGYCAIKELLNDKTAAMVALKDGKIVAIPFTEVFGQKKELDQTLFDMFKITC